MIGVAAFVVAAGLYLAVMAAASRAIFGPRRRVIVVARTPGHQCRLGGIDADRAVIAEAERIIDEAPR